MNAENDEVIIIVIFSANSAGITSITLPLIIVLGEIIPFLEM